MDVAALADALGAATLDCLNPRGPLAAYASVRDVCTLRILVKSATPGPPRGTRPRTFETRRVLASLDALQASYDSLAEALAGGDPTARDAAFDACVSKLRAFAAALLARFPLDDARAKRRGRRSRSSSRDVKRNNTTGRERPVFVQHGRSSRPIFFVLAHSAWYR